MKLHPRVTAWAVVVFTGAAFVYFCWHPLVGTGGIRWSAVKAVPPPVEFVVGDHLAYQAIARNAQEGGSVFVEPFTGLGTSIYPSGYYWFIGTVADQTGLNIQQVWNTLGVLIAIGLVIAAGLWARWALPGRLAWAAAVAPLLVGTLGWWVDRQWLGLFHDSTVALWAPYVLIAMGGGEAFSMFLLTLALLALVGALTANGHRRVLLAGLAGVGFGLLFHTHAYTSIFGIYLCIAVLFVTETLERRARLWCTAWSAVLLACAVAFSLDIIDLQPTSRLAALAFLAVIAVATHPGWLARTWQTALAIGVPLVVIASPVALRLLHAAAEQDGFFSSRQQASIDRNLAFPPSALLFYQLPIWALAIATIIGLSHRDLHQDRRRLIWLAVVVALALVTALLTLNHLWGVDQEPYRFLPYGSLLIAITCMPWLWEVLTAHARRPKALAAPVIALLCATVPTTVAYSRANAHATPLDPIADERSAYASVTKHVDNQLTLFDSCFWPELARVTGGPHTATFQPGLADPPAADKIAEVRHLVLDAHTLPPTSLLRDAGVKWFVTHDRCAGVPQVQIRRAFGAPQFTFPLPGAERFGYSATTRYRLYRVRPE